MEKTKHETAPASSSSEKASIVSLDKLPPVLQSQRKKIREMMKARSEQEGSPIPPKLAISAADSVFFLVLYRVTARAMLKRNPFPDADTLTNDIARAAETIETCIQVMGEEVIQEQPDLVETVNPGKILER